MARVLSTYIDDSGTFLTGSMATHTQENERSTRLIASSSLSLPPLPSLNTAYSSSRYTCLRCTSQRTERAKVCNGSATSTSHLSTVWVDLKNPRGGPDAQSLGQTREYMHDHLHRHPFAMKDRPMMLRKVAFAGATVALALPPGSAIEMAMCAEVAQSQQTHSDSHRGDKSALKYRSHGSVDWSMASDHVASETVAWHVSPRGHTGYRVVCVSTRQET